MAEMLKYTKYEKKRKFRMNAITWAVYKILTRSNVRTTELQGVPDH